MEQILLETITDVTGEASTWWSDKKVEKKVWTELTG